MHTHPEIARLLAATKLEETQSRNACIAAVRIVSRPRRERRDILHRYVIRPASYLHLAGLTSERRHSVRPDTR